MENFPMPANFQSQEGTLGRWKTHAPDDFDWSGEAQYDADGEEGFWPVTRLKQQYIDYLAAKVMEYEEQKQARHFYHGAQWTPEDLKILRSRRQPVITFNRTARKIDSIVGLVQRLRQDPKAFPRNPKNASGAEIATQCVRAVLDANRWKFLDNYCARQAATEGIAGVELKLIEGDHDDPDVGMDFIFGDDFFYDPRSYKPDFSDARYMGIAKWLDLEEAIELFPDKEEELRTLMVETGFDLTTHADREYKWIYVNEKRLRLVEHWYKHRGKWYWSFYCSMILLDQGVSPFLDERRKPMNRFIMFSANVDHDGDRYGFVRNLKGPQDEINQRRSKALFISNSRRLIAQKGAVDNIEVARCEWARPDGFVEVNPGRDIKPEERQEDLTAHLELMQDARNEIDSFANIGAAQLMQDSPDAHSGVAINLIQRAGVAELGSFFLNYKDWKERVYKAIWNVASRTWQQERWIRVTDNQGLAQFIQLNGMGMNQWGQPTILNAVGDLSVEMTMDEGPDEASIMQDAWDVLRNQPPGTVPPAVLIELSPMQDSVKKRVHQMMQPPPPQPDPAAQAKIQVAQIGAQTAQAKGQAEIAKSRMQAQADETAARAELLNNVQDAQARREEMAVERQRMWLQMRADQQKHAFDMEKIREQRRTTQLQHQQRRRQMRQPARRAA
jgi:hypothetical protein